MKNALILDFATSLQYRADHIPGAAFANRSRLASHTALLTYQVVCTWPDGLVARYAATDPQAQLKREVHRRGGRYGRLARRRAGHGGCGETLMLEPPEDIYCKPHDHKSQVEAAMQDYLQWEVALVEQIRRDPDCCFRDTPAQA